MSEKYVVRLCYRWKDLRHTQFVTIQADDADHADWILDQFSSCGEVIGTEAEADEIAKEAAKRGRHPTGDELEWAKSVARKRGLI